MAYVYMPLFFTVLGYGIIYFAALPLIKVASSVSSIVMSSNVPNFNDTQLSSLLDAPANSADTTPGSSNSATEISLPTSGIVYGSSFQMPTYGSLYAKITCERIDLDAPVYFGDSDEILMNGIGQYIGSSIPGCGTPIMYAAHRSTYFSPLQYAEIGDIIKVTTHYGIFEYEVSGTKIANAKDKSAYDLRQNTEQLIMYTCYPFNSLETPVNRYFVFAEKVSGPEVKLFE